MFKVNTERLWYKGVNDEEIRQVGEGYTFKQPSKSAKAHVPALVQSKHINLHGSRFNNFVALKVTNVLSSMTFFWACVALDLGALVLGNPGSWTPLVWIMFVSQTVIQLLALPAIAAGQRLISAASDARADQDHKTLRAIHLLTSEVHTLTEQQMTILAALGDK